MLSWIHIGDLHASAEDAWQSLDLLSQAVAEINAHLAPGVDFVFLPGDNANHGTLEQFLRIRDRLAPLRVPIHIIPGDHDFEPGSLDNFYAGLQVPRLPYRAEVGGCRCLFLDVVSHGGGGPDFRLGADQAAWLERELAEATRLDRRRAVFMHAFPEDFASDAEEVGGLFARRAVSCVDTGHTHYNEVLNDGSVIYTATRSTGQVEEGPPGYSVHALDGQVTSWRFKALGSGWPFVMITAPADARLVTDSSRAGRSSGRMIVQVKVFGEAAGAPRLRLDGGPPRDMRRLPGSQDRWEASVEDLPDGEHTLRVEASGPAGTVDADTIRVLVGATPPGAGMPRPGGHGLHSQSIGPWEERALLGTQLGPNKAGRKW